jgi:hypothetical protein
VLSVVEGVNEVFPSLQQNETCVEMSSSNQVKDLIAK